MRDACFFDCTVGYSTSERRGTDGVRWLVATSGVPRSWRRVWARRCCPNEQHHRIGSRSTQKCLLNCWCRTPIIDGKPNPIAFDFSKLQELAKRENPIATTALSRCAPLIVVPGKTFTNFYYNTIEYLAEKSRTTIYYSLTPTQTPTVPSFPLQPPSPSSSTPSS